MPGLTDARDREILEHLNRVDGSDVQELCDLLSVTRTAIRQRLSRLEATGLVSAETQAQTRGRQRRYYKITPEGLHALGENYRELAVVLWEVITGLSDDSVRSLLINNVRDRLARRYALHSLEPMTVGEKVNHLANDMKASGFNVEAEHSGGLHILRETSCPFPMLADIDETICKIERQVMEQVLGSTVEFGSRCRDGHNCCEFHVKSKFDESE